MKNFTESNTATKSPIPAIEGTPAQKELFAKIWDWDLSQEKLYCRNRLGYKDSVHLDKMEAEYKKFIFLLCTYHDLSLPISEKIDDLWHSHVLHSRQYNEFCNHVFGRQIYHNPTNSDEQNLALRPAYDKSTLPLYSKHFGTPPVEFWVNIRPGGSCCTH